MLIVCLWELKLKQKNCRLEGIYRKNGINTNQLASETFYSLTLFVECRLLCENRCKPCLFIANDSVVARVGQPQSS